LPAQKLGNQLFIKREDLEAFLRSSRKRNKEERSQFLERAVSLQRRIRARMGGVFDISSLIEEVREKGLR